MDINVQKHVNYSGLNQMLYQFKLKVETNLESRSSIKIQINTKLVKQTLNR